MLPSYSDYARNDLLIPSFTADWEEGDFPGKGSERRGGLISRRRARGLTHPLPDVPTLEDLGLGDLAPYGPPEDVPPRDTKGPGAPPVEPPREPPPVAQPRVEDNDLVDALRLVGGVAGLAGTLGNLVEGGEGLGGEGFGADEGPSPDGIGDLANLQPLTVPLSDIFEDASSGLPEYEQPRASAPPPLPPDPLTLAGGFVPFVPSEQDYGLEGGGSVPSEQFDPTTAEPWPLDPDVLTGRSGGSVYLPPPDPVDLVTEPPGAEVLPPSDVVSDLVEEPPLDLGDLVTAGEVPPTAATGEMPPFNVDQSNVGPAQDPTALVSEPPGAETLLPSDAVSDLVTEPGVLDLVNLGDMAIPVQTPAGDVPPTAATGEMPPSDVVSDLDLGGYIGPVAGTVAGLADIGQALFNEQAPDLQRALQGAGGAAQVYGALTPALDLPQIPYLEWARPLLSAASAASGAENVGMGLAQGALGLVQGGLAALGPGGAGAATLFYPAFEAIGGTIYDAFHEPSHAERERAEVARALGAAQGMVRDVSFATTPEELAEVLSRYNQGFAGHTISGPTEIASILADPGTYSAAIQAGVDPSYLTEPNATLTQRIRQQAAVIALAQQGHPEARAYLDRQRAAKQEFATELFMLLGLDPQTAVYWPAGLGPRPSAFGEGDRIDPYLYALSQLADWDNDFERLRERSPVLRAAVNLADEGLAPEPLNVGVVAELPPAVATILSDVINPAVLIQAGVAPANATDAQIERIVQQARSDASEIPIPWVDTTLVRVPDYLGMAPGTVVTRQELDRLEDNYRSGGG